MTGLYHFSVFLHVLCAAAWIGTMLSLPFILLPAIRNHPDRIDLLYQSGIRLRIFGWITLGLLLVTGLTNIHLRGLPFSWAFFTDTPYGRTVSLKILLFSIIVLLSGTHDFMIGGRAIDEMRRSENSRLKQVARWTGRINLLLALLAAYLGVVISRGGF